jgi:hypothetical protein
VWLDQKGEKQLQPDKEGQRPDGQGFLEEHFFVLLDVFTHRFNWVFQDRYPAFWIIQGWIRLLSLPAASKGAPLH